ncbi:sigma-70 family RNA polymerase sigma factor [uncultured Maricaulis sp.]|uniref:sigma-70 family RNA polymerase sigma factor n=1 Tax=uncultured Maricaulis sp. TaxID=174710 RepID=UPI00260CB2B0|nr:sigma-70 family RNA polymerase sigma factor [uncultured Maricaulis sp.]
MDPERPKALLKQVSLGSRSAFSELYDITNAKLFGVTLRILHDRAEAEEAVQDCYLNVWRRAAKYDAGRASAMSWLIAVARNAAIDRLRRRRETAPLESAPEPADESHSAEDLVVFAGEADRLHDCLGALSGKESEFVRQAFMTGQSYPEVARAADKPLGTVKSVIRRALMKLRDCLEPS